MDGEKTRGADARKVRLLLTTAGLDRRLSLTPPISMHLLLTTLILLASVLRRIALRGKRSNSENSVSDVDSGVVRWANADLVTHNVPWA